MYLLLHPCLQTITPTVLRKKSFRVTEKTLVNLKKKDPGRRDEPTTKNSKDLSFEEGTRRNRRTKYLIKRK